MSQEENIGIARRLLADISGQKDPDAIAAMFSENVVFEIPGDDGALPWIGRKKGRSAFTGFIRGIRSLTEPIRFDIHEVLAGDTRAVITGELATRVKATGKVIESAIAIILTISNGEITRFQMLEDSFAVSRAARTS